MMNKAERAEWIRLWKAMPEVPLQRFRVEGEKIPKGEPCIAALYYRPEKTDED